ncbi:hypothetical protein [Ciceribacter sp. RN22]|uniref:hypothetical protein n=1 Tax=Ciceribacter sp. RN22 TaxID=2954932 RepID=UPI00209356DE|nr:hypothetical protein [Ciceribacter sp. RN22]MCO6180971.1 hypothetical protein [Ciceribacter sp. RN22]
MAEAADLVRFGDSEGETTTPIRPEQLLIPAVMTTAHAISGPSSTSRKKTASRAACEAFSATSSVTRAA